MKVLFINSLEPNQGDFYFLGLREVLGEKNVVEYPYKPLYHCYIKNVALVAEDLHGNIAVKEDPQHGTLKYSYADYPVPKIFGLLGSKEYPISGFPNLANYDLIVCSFLRGSTPLILERILSHASAEIPPVLFIDGEDDFYVRNVIKEKRILKYFKREILISLPKDLLFNVIKPIGHYLLMSTSARLSRYEYLGLCKPICIAYDGFPAKASPLNLTIPDYGFRPDYDNKIYDLSFIANATSKLRIKIYYELLKISKMYKLKFFVYLGTKFCSGIPWRRYAEIIAKSKLSISVPGAGFDTYRYWEIPYYGAALVSWKPWINIPNNFIEGESAVFFEDFNELEKKILYCLKTDEWELLAKRAREHFLRYHTPAKRAYGILSALRHSNDHL
jgi:hypothetical protein